MSRALKCQFWCWTLLINSQKRVALKVVEEKQVVLLCEAGGLGGSWLG